jgi:hypothetical protein
MRFAFFLILSGLSYGVVTLYADEAASPLPSRQSSTPVEPLCYATAAATPLVLVNEPASIPVAAVWGPCCSEWARWCWENCYPCTISSFSCNENTCTPFPIPTGISCYCDPRCG